ncbi:FKBP-type peptidyl-prolyl cis-trans isomerase [Kluyvera genomosp. 1]|uniref:FKBP-type peptidyl-prolyl cis-trans isomerase n=1 Tax=Kluyvera genomosp. 1 TaxID=2774053 RepID=UPI00068AB84C|nr:FKBP-type peptidyl-prolyl cis-trans isomerase [Kluyvera genomosp. 1]
MKILITLYVNTLALIITLALLFSHNAYAEQEMLANVTANSNSNGSGPAFLDYAQQQTQENKNSEKIAVSKPINTEIVNNSKPQHIKRISDQSSTIAQKDKTIRQLQKQLADKSTAISSAPAQQQMLVAKLKQLQEKLDAATAEKQQLIQQALAVDKTKTQNTAKSAETAKMIAQQAAKLSLVESEKHKLETFLSTVAAQEQELKTQLANTEAKNREMTEKLTSAVSDKRTFTEKLTASEAAQKVFSKKVSDVESEKENLLTKLNAITTEKEALTKKLGIAAADKQAITAKLTDTKVELLALTTKLDLLTIAQLQSSENNGALAQQVEKDKQRLLAQTDQIKQLNAQLSSTNSKSKTTPLDLSSESQQQAYSIGVSLGDKALKMLSTRDAQGIKIDLNTALQGIADAFSGTIALDEKTRDKALFTASEKVARSLQKVEQQAASDGKRYQEEFAKQKGVMLSQGAYSRIDSLGEGKIHDDDIVTVTIKEMLTDGTVINDMAAEDKVLSQKLKTYPPIFLAAIKRLQNHGTVTIVIPAERAYGTEGRPPKIPPGATMVYSVSIIDTVAANPLAKQS